MTRLSIIGSLLLLAGAATAQTPAGFTPEVAEHLDVIFGTKAASPPGTSFAKADVQKQPTIGTSDVALKGTYLWMMIDIDVPASFTAPTSGPRKTNLHAMISGFKAGADQASDGVNVLTSTATGPVKYVGPAPPAENPPYAHRYVELLFETDDSFAVTTADVGQTFGFDVNAFIAKVKLDPPIRANYFNVTG